LQLENEVSRGAGSTAAIPTLSVEMIEDVINSMKLGKACGPDNLSAEHLKYSHVIRPQIPVSDLLTCFA
jgi:hypothetical protein